jgi:hypothetical protein
MDVPVDVPNELSHDIEPTTVLICWIPSIDLDSPKLVLLDVA